MRPSVKTRWIRALRSDKYKQTTSILRDGPGEGYCCLGVLCDIIDPEGWGAESDDYDYEDYESKWTYKGDVEEDTLPVSLRKRLNIENQHVETLINMNDTENKSFTEIADWIQENL